MLDVPIRRVATGSAIPTQADVVVVGGGIVGVSTALALARRNVNVVLCEKGLIGGEQSGRNWGWVRAAIRDPREIPLAAASLHMWRRLDREVGAETGFRQTGSLFACQTDAQMARYSAWHATAASFGLSSRLLSGSEVQALVPQITGRLVGGLFTPEDGRAEPDLATSALAEAAIRAGATLLQGVAVRGVERAGGRAAGVVTEGGKIKASAVVLAGGVWSRLFLQPLDIDLPQLKIQGSVLRTAPLEGGPDGTAWFSRFAYRKRLDGGYTIADGTENRVSVVPDHFRLFRQFLPALRSEWPTLRLRIDGRFLEEALRWRPTPLDEVSLFERIRCLQPRPITGSNRRALAAAAETMPVFAKARIVDQWSGFIDVTPDAIPVISPAETVPGLFVSTGYSGHGFGVGPAAGQLTADLVTGDAPLVDPSPFRLSRFSDGSVRSVGKLT